MLFDDLSGTGLISALGTRWRSITNQVMGSIPLASVAQDIVDGHPSLRHIGDIRLDNNGGFVPAWLDLTAGDGSLVARDFSGLHLTARGNCETYSVNLRSAHNAHPWQSYRAYFQSAAEWEMIDMPFASFVPQRLEIVLDVTKLRLIGLVAIGRAFRANLIVSDLRF